jgi:sec-independent protein translocase protein TatA
MITLLQMPQGAEWLLILAVVVLLFGSAKLPALVRSLGKSKKIWEEEIGSGRKKGDELTKGDQATGQQAVPPAPPAQQQPNQVNGQSGDGVPPTHTAN